MYYRCKSCERVEFRGVLPGATCGLIWISQMAIAFVLLVVLTRAIIPGGLGWWWVLALPVLILVAFFLAVLGEILLESLEWLVVRTRACEACGKRRWSFPFTDGFGA